MEEPNETQLLLDQKIFQLQQSIQLLKNERNQHARIAQLPPEVLGRVFVEALGVVREFGKLIPLAQRFNFSFVSQIWRGVAISTPEIWGILPDGHLDWCRVMLERSRTTGLTLETNLSDFESPKAKFVQEVILNHRVRLRELKITFSFFYENGGTQLFLDAFPTSAPRLHARLSSLELKGHSLDWTSSMLTGLKKLKMINNTSTTTLSNFLGALRRMPDLESLDLENSIPLTNLESNSPVQLPALQQLRISSDSYDGLSPLQYFAIPASTIVDLRCTASAYSIQSNLESLWSRLSLTISHFLASMTSGSTGILPAFHTLSLSFLSAYTIKAWRKPWTYSSPNMHRTDAANFSLQLNAAGPSITKLIPNVLTQINTLALSAIIDEGSLIQTFGDISTLRTIVLDGRSGILESLSRALNPQTDNMNASYNQVAFSRLENLVMYNTIFSEQDGIDYITLDDLVDCLIQRFEHGVPIQKLAIFESFDIYDDDIGLLEEVVVDVEWDEVTMECEEEGEDDYDEDRYDLDYDSDQDYEDDDFGYHSFSFY
ncbi:hypothetical protein CPB83DRAFT_905358 [Crepidotus variabilis]|uniref:F-box domain-containing protein n=1 Tax=Crepidotus variabilis TaxID=179855 RepID=A0A9P6EKC3_9AGAR|nr:hypothetical protein CPB83DRAFT_905358 [Crepidotus variabilis]